MYIHILCTYLNIVVQKSTVGIPIHGIQTDNNFTDIFINAENMQSNDYVNPRTSVRPRNIDKVSLPRLRSVYHAIFALAMI